LVTRRKQFKRSKLRWRVFNPARGNYSLGWTPFKKPAIAYRNGHVFLAGMPLSLWDSYGLRLHPRPRPHLRESCMRENRTCSLSGGRRPARKRASSDPTPEKLLNNGIGPAEVVEERGVAQGNANHTPASRTQSRIDAPMGLEGVRQKARLDKRARIWRN
jgi:hypothetical protein